MPGAKYTLTLDEQAALAKVRSFDQAMSGLDASAKKAGASVDKVFASIGKSVSFHGSRPMQSIANDLLGRMDERGIAALVEKHAGAAAKAARSVGLRAEVQRLRSRLESDPAYLERAAAAESMRVERFGGSRHALGKERAQVSRFIVQHGLGEASDPLTQVAARVVRQKLRNVERVMVDTVRNEATARQVEGEAAAGREIANAAAARRRQRINGRFTAMRVGGGREIEPPSTNLLAGEGLLAGGADDAAAAQEDVRQRRKARLKEVQRLRGARNTARWNVGMQIAGGVAGAGAGAIYAGEQILGNYNERLGVQYFGALAGIEPTFREVMGMPGNPERQKQVRQQITDAAIANGRNIGETSSFFYDILSAAGNLSPEKQQQIIKSALQFQNVAGGELPIIGQAMTTMQQLYGGQVGSVDRMSSIIKKAIDYGKFSPTGFAKLSPEAFSAASLYGVPMEQAAAMMAVVSTRSGRDENMFTGSRYTFAMMGKAADAGLVDRNADFLTKLRQLRKASPGQLKETFGMEGLNVVSNARDMIDDIDALYKEMRGMTGKEISGLQNQILRDPVNSLSRLAQSAEVASGNILPSLIQTGGPEGLNLASEAIKTRFAMAGQASLAPDIAALTDVTKNIDLARNKERYVDVAYQATQAALAAQNDAGARHQMQVNAISNGKVRLPVDLNWVDKLLGDQDETRESKGEDLARFEKMRADENAPELHAGEFAQVEDARSKNNFAYADRILAQARDRSARLAVAGDGGRGLGIGIRAVGRFAADKLGGAVGDIIPAGVLSKFGIDSTVINGGKVRDAFNKATIASSFTNGEKALADAKAGGDPFAIDATRTRLTGMRTRRRELMYDADGFTATDRQALATEFTGGGGASDPTQVLLSGIQSAIQSGVAQLVAAFNGHPAGTPGAPAATSQPSQSAPPTKRSPVSATTRPVNP